MVFLSFLLLLALSALIAFGFAFYALRHQQTPGARPFAFVLLGHGLSAAWYACELIADSLTWKIVWDNLQFTSLDIIVIGYLWFALEYTHRRRAIRWLLPLFCGLPVLDALLVWTNPAHQIVRSASHIVVQGDLSVLAYTYGPWFWFFVSYIYLGALVAVGLLAVAFVRASRSAQLHMSAIIIGMLAPLVSGMFTVSGLIPLPELDHLDVSPLTYLLIAPLWTWALFRHRVLDLMPIARSRLVEAMLDGVLVVDAHGRIADCNESAHAMLHDTDTPCIGTSAKALLPTLLLIAEPTRIRTKSPRAATPPDAEQAWLEIRSTPLYDKRHRLVGWLVVLHDQTEHWQMERALRQQNARLEQEIAERQQAEEAYRNLVQFSFQGLLILQEGRVVFANPAIEAIHGYSVAELQAMAADDLMALIHPDDRMGVEQLTQAYIDGTASTHHNEHRIITKQGQVRWVDVSIALVEFRRAPAFQLALIDITERKQAEEALRASEARFAAFMDYLPGVAFIHDQDGRILFANPVYCHHLGASPEDVIGQRFSQFLPSTLVAYFHDQDQQVLASRQVFSFEDQAEIDGQDVTFMTTKFPIQTNEQTYAIGGVSFDITERKQAEEAYRTLVDNSLQGLIIYQDGRILFANAAASRITGYSLDEILAMSPEESAVTIYPADRALVAQRLQARLRGEAVPPQYAFRITRKDGSLRWVEVFATRIHYRGRDAIQMAYIDITERKQAEEALRASEARLKAIFDNAAVGIGLTDNAGKSIAVNARGAQQLGYTLEELAYLSNLELTHPDDQAATVELVQQLLQGEIAGYRIEKRYFRKDGSILWADLSVSPVYDDNGQIAYLLGIVVDITERKQAEEALRASEQFVQQITATVPDIVYIYDLNLQSNIYSNRQMTDILGYSPAEVQAMGSNVMATLVHPDDLPRVRDHLRRAADIYGPPNTIGTLEYRMRHRDGQWRWLLSREVVFMRTDDGQPWQLLGIAHDITERKQAEESLRTSEQLVQQIAATIPGILYVYDLTLQRNIYSNRQIWQVLGYTDEEVQEMGSRMMPTLLHPDDLLRLEHHIMQHEEAEDGTIVTHEYRMLHRDGQWRWLLSYEVVFSRTVEGQPQQILGIAQDITERKQLEQQLQEANALLREQAIRDPLTGLYNRRYLDEMVSREVQRAERHEQPFGIIMLDIDHFKHFNDSYGHDAGDALLRAISAFLKNHTRGEDVACRYGGEEFILVLAGASLEDTRQRAEDLWTGIQALEVEHQGQILDTVTVSLGVAVFPQHGATGYAVIQAADRALYRAKHQGRNHVEAAEEEDEHSTSSPPQKQ